MTREEVTMIGRIDQLANAGLMDRIPDEKDRKILKIKLSPYGNSFIKNIVLKIPDTNNR
jgi:DNA-binding MarR family transcriptional regulator